MIRMMDSIMPYCKKWLNWITSLFFVMTLLSTSWADGVSVSKAELRSNDTGYYLSANFNLELSFSVEQALMRGIPLYFVSEFVLKRSRWYWLDEDIFHSEQSVKLAYNVLTRQYRVSRGALYRTFTTLPEALAAITVQSSASFPASLIKKSGSYVASLANEDFIGETRFKLDTEQLPKLLQVNALTSDDWSIRSNWYQWHIKPVDVVEDKQ